jgi:uncharacterized protein YcfL
MSKYFSLALLPFLFACQTNQEVGSIDSRKGDMEDVVGKLPDFIHVVNLETDHSQDFAQGLAIIGNDLDKTITVHYRFRWFDEQGREVNSNVTRWNVARVMGHEQKEFHSTALRPGQLYFKIDLNIPDESYSNPQYRSKK